MKFRGLFFVMLLTHLATLADRSVEAGAPADPESEAVTIVTLGDSITKGVRPGVQAGETFAALVQEQLRGRRIPAKVINVGIGGERTDQAPSRLATDVLTHKPDVVTVMYGTNDSYVDLGKDASRLSITEFDRNLRVLVRALRLHGIEPVLMTEPRWAEDAMPNGAGEHPNVRLERYVEVCREVARDEETGLVDHFKLWTDAEANGQSLRAWTTDGCHPNGRGHHELAAAMLPVLLEILKPQEVKRVGYRTRLETIFQHDAGDFLWFHPRTAAVPGKGINGGPAVVMTLQKHLRVSDYYSGVSVMRSDDLGASWSRSDPRPELDWVQDDQGIVVAVADVTPGWHAPTGKLIAVGAQVRYSTEGRQLEDKRRAHQTAYAVYDPGTGAWSRWQVLEMPEDENFNFARSACAQWLVEPDGTVLLPFYFGPSADVPHSVTVVRCGFDGERLRYLEHGNELVLNVVRGLVEPSLVRFQGRYYLTIRNDVKGYVTTSRDGLRYRSIQPWRFDDGAELGSYNTQQHWLSSDDGLFLVYTRRGANNDHIMRHRAPLFIAQVNPRTLRVMRSTEQVLVSERGATLGNFGASRITAKESWVTVAEGVWSDDARRRGAEGAVFVGRVTWSDP